MKNIYLLKSNRKYFNLFEKHLFIHLLFKIFTNLMQFIKLKIVNKIL